MLQGIVQASLKCFAEEKVVSNWDPESFSSMWGERGQACPDRRSAVQTVPRRPTRHLHLEKPRVRDHSLLLVVVAVVGSREGGTCRNIACAQTLVDTWQETLAMVICA